MQQHIINFIESQAFGIELRAGEMFRWNPQHQFVEYIPDESQQIEPALLLLHEIGHGLLQHQTYHSDIDLLRKEVQAWSKARTLAKEVGIDFNEEVAETCLDTYRYWTEKRSTCPDCDFTGYQDKDNFYHCLNCRGQWKVNAAQNTRVCRITVKKGV